MEIKTKFGIGDTVYWANYAGVCCGCVESVRLYKNDNGWLVVAYILEGERDEEAEKNLFPTFQEAETKWKRLRGLVQEEKLKLYNSNGKSTR